jgi:multidrug efflux pump subunit AcrA (membrane-fusion protein)
VSGVSPIAIVPPTGRAHWVTVTVGIQQGNNVEIVSPSLAVGTSVIVAGQVGLPDSTRVRQAPLDSSVTP